MASFKVIEQVRIPEDAETRFIAPGAIYIPGDQIGGLIAAEAAELVAIAPSAFEPLDEEARVVCDWYAKKVAAEAE